MLKDLIKKEMAKNNLNCDVRGRYKNYYSIYNKMHTQNIRFEEIYDLIAFRIILDTIPQCYEALGDQESRSVFLKRLRSLEGNPE